MDLIQFTKRIATALANGFVVLGPSLSSNDRSYLMEQGSVPGSTERDGLWENCGDTCPGDAV